MMRWRMGRRRLLLRIGQALRAVHGVDVAFILLGGGPLEAEYQAVAPTRIVRRHDRSWTACIQAARATGCNAAIVSSAASARAVPLLQAHGIHSVLLVHELPRLLREKALLEALRQGLGRGGHGGLPGRIGARPVLRRAGRWRRSASVVLPQGIDDHRATPRRTGRDPGRIACAAGASPGAGHGLCGSAEGVRPVPASLACTRSRERRRSASPGPAGSIPAIQAYLGAEIAAAEAHWLLPLPGSARRPGRLARRGRRVPADLAGRPAALGGAGGHGGRHARGRVRRTRAACRSC